MEFVHARLEDLELPRESYAAVFSASAIHWVDPDLGWREIADALAPNGTLALIQYFGLQEQRSVDDQKALLSVLRRHAPEIAATWPIYRDLDRTIAGVKERRRNVADAWAWLAATTSDVTTQPTSSRTCSSQPCRPWSSTAPMSSTPCSPRCRSGLGSHPASVMPS